jgi:ABC-type transport system substrate-binding protein
MVFFIKRWGRYQGNLIIIVTVFVLLFLIAEAFMDAQKNQFPLRVGNNFNRSVLELDPANIQNLAEYEFVDYLYGRLVQYDANQQLVTDLAETFYWDNNNLIFEFGKSHKTSNGELITAEDAYYSIKRAIYLRKTGHGDLRSFLCPNHVLKSIYDDCPGIKFHDNKLILTPVETSYSSFLLPFLESADFSIISKKNIDFTATNLPIKSFDNATGPYYVAKDATDGSWILKANKYNPKYSTEMPQEVHMVPASFQNAYELLINDRIDLVPTYLGLTWGKNAQQVYDNPERFNSFQTLPIKVIILCFTPDAVKNFSIEQRMQAGKSIAEAFKKRSVAPGSVDTFEFFQGVSDGNLNDDQKEIIKALRNNLSIKAFNNVLRFSTNPGAYDHYKDKLKENLEIDVVERDTAASGLPLSERLDTYLIVTDSAWNENISLLGHNFAAGIFHLPNFNKEKWLNEYIHTDNRETRLEKLRTLHFELLKQGVIYPITVSSYMAFGNKKWKLNFLPFIAGSQLWRMRR